MRDVTLLTEAAHIERQKHSPMEIHHFGHKHPLTCVSIEFSTDCSGCLQPISGSVYRCAKKCWFHIHKSCAELPGEIRHPLHPQHPLTLLPKGFYGCNLCHACGYLLTGFVFHCSECEFDLDINCASLMPTKNHQGHEQPIHNFNQTHPLIVCDMIPCAASEHFKHSCFTCTLPFEDLVYVCLECKLLLHKTCAELPLEIKHPFHPQHPLTLLPRPLLNHQYCDCLVCGESIYYWNYHCLSEAKETHCSHFYLHAKCASLVPTIKSKLHEHPLAFINNNKNFNFIYHACIRFISTPFFRCVDCDYNLHVHCNPTLPQTIKHECHQHSFILTKSPVKNHRDDKDADEEFYCDACDKRRNLFEPTYFCAECHYICCSC